MTVSFQTLVVGAFVTLAHIAVIAAIRPATLEASKFFQTLNTDAFVEETLVKKGEWSSDSENNPKSQGILANRELEKQPPMIGSPETDQADSGKIQSAEEFIDQQGERDSMKAVTDVRVFSGRIEEPDLKEYTSARLTATPIEAETAIKKPVPEPETSNLPKMDVPGKPIQSLGPLKVREIAPVSRP